MKGQSTAVREGGIADQGIQCLAMNQGLSRRGSITQYAEQEMHARKRSEMEVDDVKRTNPTGKSYRALRNLYDA